MTVKETPCIKAQIKNYKQWLERHQLFNYRLKLNDAFYYYIRFTKFGKGTGLLILKEDGSVPPREEAIPVLRYISSYNYMIVASGGQLAKDKKRPVWVLEEIRELLDRLIPHVSSKIAPVQLGG